MVPVAGMRSRPSPGESLVVPALREGLESSVGRRTDLASEAPQLRFGVTRRVARNARIAAERAREYEASSGHFERRPAVRPSAPLLAEFAERCLEEDTGHLAATSAADRRTHLRPGGPLIEHFGAWPLDEITPAALREWWGLYVANSEERGPKTGREYINALSAVFGYAIDLGLMERSPIPDFRAQLRRRSRTKQARAGKASKIHPITDPAALGRLLEAARERSLRSYVAVLLMLR